MKILLLGANGQLGRSFLSHGGLGNRGELLPASRDGILHGGRQALVADLADTGALEVLLDAERPQVIVNTAAYTAVDKAEQEEDLATLVNGYALSVIGGWAARHGALVVHYSTDYVFDGQASAPYTEDAATAPSGAYGRSKLAGEDALRASGAAHFIFRTAWVYSAVGHNFLRTMLRLGAERDELRVVADQRGTPSDTGFIVEASLAALDRWMAADDLGRERLQGTYHLTAAGDTTWHGFAEMLLGRATERGLLARTPKVIPITTSEFPTPAKRPAYSVLDTSRLARTFDIDVPMWQSGVERVLATLSEPE
ncbi:dTDP-4-dehydrorhamnose reductase [Luteibacter aegosomatis]|uniref:dTDP-4-dehydrorhamnose reductase n=1 Tax=Luteibacter aegosomatis TaxID=2911537 RepID=UPI001FFB8A2F|nr:dTDP-4-dehydrorhamnose reductase [Luteibacter aegosomatis]UPG86525.1 dTDP-4-dehydrorhamnose reductase [Luteibacter aegosomatis]